MNPTCDTILYILEYILSYAPGSATYGAECV